MQSSHFSTARKKGHQALWLPSLEAVSQWLLIIGLIGIMFQKIYKTTFTGVGKWRQDWRKSAGCEAYALHVADHGLIFVP